MTIENINSNRALYLFKQLNDGKDIKQDLINIIKKDDMLCICLISEKIITDNNERLKIIKKSVNRTELIKLLIENKLTKEEYDIAFRKIIQHNNSMHQLIEKINNIPEQYQRLLFDRFSHFDYNRILNSQYIYKFIPQLQNKIVKEILINNPNQAYEFLIDNKNKTLVAQYRNLALNIILKSGTCSYDFFCNGKPTNEERKMLLKKLVTLRSFLKRLFNNQMLSIEENQLLIDFALKNQDPKVLPVIYKFMPVSDEMKEPLLPYVLMSEISNI